VWENWPTHFFFRFSRVHSWELLYTKIFLAGWWWMVCVMLASYNSKSRPLGVELISKCVCVCVCVGVCVSVCLHTHSHIYMLDCRTWRWPRTNSRSQTTKQQGDTQHLTRFDKIVYVPEAWERERERERERDLLMINKNIRGLQSVLSRTHSVRLLTMGYNSSLYSQEGQKLQRVRFSSCRTRLPVDRCKHPHCLLVRQSTD